jgi:hypothetical protein
MSDISISEGQQYTALFHGGPFDGTTETRTATGDRWDESIVAYAGVEGLETAFEYSATGAKQILDQVHIDYTYDPKDSDPVDALDERGDRTGEFDRE